MHPNPPKTTRGIQESDVWAAADALIAMGQRPTIERVRLHIGRGSPNTVAPMLDSWYATLGARLGVSEKTEHIRNSIPTEVLEVAQTMWGSALERAHDIASQTLAEKEAQLQLQAETLEQQQAQLAQREDTLAQQKKSMDEALKLAQAQRQDLSRRLDEMQQQLQEREVALTQLRQDIANTNKLRDADREQHSQEMQAAAQERQRLAEQFAGNERRMLADLDRSRQDSEKIKKAAAEAERKAQTRYEELQVRHASNEEELLTLRATHINAQQSLQVAHERIAELKTLLEMQRASHSTLASSAAGAEGTKPAAKSSGSLQRRALSQRSLRGPRK